MSAPYTHKRGDTFNFGLYVKATVNGAVQTDLTGWTGISQIRQMNDAKIADLTFSWDDASTAAGRLYAASTTGWPLGDAVLDVQLTTPAGEIISSETIYIDILGDVTR